MINTIAAKEAVVFAAAMGRAEATPVYLDVAHRIPGRLRLRAAALKGDRRAMMEAQWVLQDIAGVRAVTANPYAGSLIIEYDPSIIGDSTLIEALSQHGYIVAPASPRAQELENKGQLVKAIGRSLLEALVERIAIGMVASMI
jgi:hypothetical protein